MRSCPRIRGVAASAATKGFGVKPELNSSQTCACGSKLVYRECCQPYHEGKAVPTSGQQLLQSRFSAYSKQKVEYLLSTDKRGNVEPDQLERDVRYACSQYAYSGLQILTSESIPDGEVVTFTFKSKETPKEKSNIKFRGVTEKAGPVTRNLDGSVKVFKTKEQSTFKSENGTWALVASEILSGPE